MPIDQQPTKRFYAGQEPTASPAKPSAAQVVPTQEARQLQSYAARAAVLRDHLAAEVGRVAERIQRELRMAAVQAARQVSGDVLYNWNKHRPAGLALLRLDAELSLVAATAACEYFSVELAKGEMADAVARAEAEDAAAADAEAQRRADAQAAAAATQEAERSRVQERADRERADRKREAFHPTTMPG